MEQTPIPPLVSDAQLLGPANNWYVAGRTIPLYEKKMSGDNVRDIYEADRAKTREVVQALVDALERTLDPTSFAMTQARLPITQHEYRRALQQGSQALALAKSQLSIEPTKYGETKYVTDLRDRGLLSQRATPNTDKT